MKSTIHSLKSAGIVFAVFLSSWTVQMEPAKVPPSEIISYVHAQVEVNLDEIYGPGNYVAVRPGAFATNTTDWKAAINEGEVKLFGPEVMFDYITSGDMGRVSGKLLTQGRQDGENHVYLYGGPEQLSQRDAIGIIGKVLGKEIKVTSIDGEEQVKLLTAQGIPEPLSKYLVKIVDEGSKGNSPIADREHYEAGVRNIERYSGPPVTRFEEWVRENSHLFS